MINFSFNVHEISSIEISECLLNIFENVDSFKKKRYLDKDTIPILHITNDASKASEELINVDHIDVGRYLFKSAFKRFNYSGNNFYTFSANHIKWDHTNVIVTNQFNDDQEPLWYGHRLPLTATDVQIISENIVVDLNKYKIITEVNKDKTEIKKVICHNLDSDAFFVRYNLNQTTYVELLNRARLFNLSFDFIDEFYSPINKLMPLYKIIKERNGLRIVFPEDSNQVGLLEKEYLISGSIPEYQFSNESWNIEVPYALFYEEDHYEVSNFNDQYFDSGRPFKTITNDVGLVTGDHFIKISYEEIQPTNIYIKLYKENSSKPDLLITNDEYLLGRKDIDFNLEWNVSNLSVSSLDQIIYVPDNISEYSFAKVTYSIRSYSYIEEAIDLNPFLNPSIKDKKVYFYLHKEYGVIYFIVNPLNKIEESSHSYYDSWLSKTFKFSHPNTYSDFSFYFSIGDNLEDQLKSDGAILLAIVNEPRCLYEYDSVLTSIYKKVLPTIEDAFYNQPKYLPIIDNELIENQWSIPELKNTEIVRIHWTRLQDYIGTNIFSKERLKKEVLKNTSAGSQILVIEDGAVFNVECTDIEIDNNRFKIEWIPPIQLSEVIQGTIYTSSDGISFSALTTIDNMIYNRSHWITFSSEEVYLKLRVRITRNGNTYFGPYSNTIHISKGVL